jgi:hypothetical protein
MNVYQKLNEAREKFHASALKKSGVNSFAKYNYFELGDFIIPALQIFKEFGLTSVIRFGTDQAVMEIVNNEKPEEKILVTSPMSTAALKGCHEVQNLGAVQTYIRRYLWVAALEIVEHDALDSSEPLKPDAVQNPKNPAKPTLDAKRLGDAITRIKEGVYTTQKLRDTFALTAEQDAQVVEALANA